MEKSVDTPQKLSSEEAELGLNLALLFSYPDMSNLPKEYAEILAAFSDKALDRFSLIEAAMAEDLESYQADYVIGVVRAELQTLYGTACMFRSEADIANRMPNFKFYEAVLDKDDFIFI